MITFTPNIYVLQYLTHTGQLAPSVESKALGFMRVGKLGLSVSDLRLSQVEESLLLLDRKGMSDKNIKIFIQIIKRCHHMLQHNYSRIYQIIPSIC